ncbi:protein-L-isoaspartate(D-aspartate) O-methyltransferase [bacterium]|nr:MAG: protein-L-isoaspartate(D-aspartate) O-methyltransferase [bacterium]
MEELVKNLINLGVLKTQAIIDGFLANDRAEFVPADFRLNAYEDFPIPIGFGQTISQPYTVAFMMELLAPSSGMRILDIGFGSGWTAGILARVASETGKIYALEIIPELFEFGKNNLRKLGYKNIEFVCKSGGDGFAGGAPYDRILVSAAASEIPNCLKDQLKIGGRIVIPVGKAGERQSIVLLEKRSAGDFSEQDYPGFAFVPFVRDAGN